MDYGKWQILQPVARDYNHGHVSKLAQPSVPATWPASVKYSRGQASKSTQQAWQLGSISTNTTSTRQYDEIKAKKYREWQVSYPVTMDCTYGHVSKLARPETQLVFQSMDRIIKEEEKAASDCDFSWLKKAA